MSGAAASADRLARALTRALGAPVGGLTRLSGGASRQTWAFEVPGAGGPRRLIGQVARPGPGGPARSMRQEAELLGAAAAAGVPVAPVVAVGDDDGLGAPWIVVERLEGETIPRRVLGQARFARARTLLTAQCARALAAVHAIEARRAGDLDATDQLDQFADLLHALDQPRPALELGLRRLRQRRPPPGPVTVVHGDFRTGNLLVDDDGLVAVLDWELAHLGDPDEDLGWFCVRAWRFGGPGPAGGFGQRQELFDAYATASGRTPDPDAVAWWEAVGTFKWAVMCLLQAASHLSGLEPSVELAAVGRRVCENEWDLLGLVGPRPEPEPLVAAAPGAPDPFGRPTAGELLAAARQFLDHDVREATTGRLRYHARVAANVVGLVERQLELGAEASRRHAARLARLGAADDAALARAIAAGAFDDRLDAVAAELAGAVADQLAVANPAHRTGDGA